MREELCYARYFKANEPVLKNIHRESHDASVRMLGIQGDLDYGLRIRCVSRKHWLHGTHLCMQEFTALQEDINQTISSGAISVRA